MNRGGSDVLTPRGPDNFSGVHPHGHPEHLHDHQHSKNGNAQHGEALRMMLGTILAPKRPSPSRSNSNSSSGTASPMPTLCFPHSHSYSSTNASPSPQPPGTPHHHLFSYPYPHIQPYPHAHSHSHRDSHSHSHPHSHNPQTPSKLGGTDHHETNHHQHHSPTSTPETSSPFFGPRPSRMSRSSSFSGSNFLSPQSVGISKSKSESSRPGGRSSQPPHDVVVAYPGAPEVVITVTSESRPNSQPLPVPVSGIDPSNKNKFIKTLEGKSAWDALIHGSFS